MNLTIHSLAHPVTSLGPGRRVVLWVAGCAKHCEGCMSPEMQDPEAGKAIAVATLLRRLLELDPRLDGLTVSGGEPFDQPAPLVALLRAARLERPQWSVLIYSGYTLNEICSDMAGRAEVLNHVDVLIDGRYRNDVPPHQPLAGSGNQCIHYLTDRGRCLRPAIEAAPPQQLNWGLGDGSFDMLIGVADESLRDTVREALGERPERGHG